MRHAFQEGNGLGTLVPLPLRQGTDDGFALTLADQVEFAAPATPTPPEFDFGSPFFAPAA